MMAAVLAAVELAASPFVPEGTGFGEPQPTDNRQTGVPHSRFPYPNGRDGETVPEPRGSDRQERSDCDDLYEEREESRRYHRLKYTPDNPTDIPEGQVTERDAGHVKRKTGRFWEYEAWQILGDQKSGRDGKEDDGRDTGQS